MSRALDFLQAARPQAMQAYFGFLKHNGGSLDPKTRALISVITKVAVQTDKGLVQYTRRALAAGATSDEILDALMMAFPALGLSRIVWAIEVLIDHGVEGFAQAIGGNADGEPPAEASGIRLDVCALDALPFAETVKYSTAGRPVLLYREQTGVRAFKGYCAHQGTELMPSGIRAGRVTCSLHGWRFDMPDGRCDRGEKWHLAELDVVLTGGRIIVVWRD